MIKLLVSMAGIDDVGRDYSHAPDDVIELDKETEAKLIESGQAEAVKKPVKVKTASK